MSTHETPPKSAAERRPSKRNVGGEEGGASALQRVVEWNKLLEGCIGARERFDAAKATIMRTRDGAGDPAAAVAAAAPLAQEFADKMAELAIIAPELSGLLASLTEGIPGRDEGGTPSRNDGVDSGGMPPPQPLSADAFEGVHELLKVVLPALAQLLSFDHLRASEPVARNLVQALVNLHEGVGSLSASGSVSQASHGSSGSSVASASAATQKNASPTESRGSPSSGSTNTQAQRERVAKKTASWAVSILNQAFAPTIYGGRLVRSEGLDELLGQNGVGKAQHHRAVQTELLKNTEVLRGLAADALVSARTEGPSGCGLGNNVSKDPSERLLDSTLQAFCSMLGAVKGGGEDAHAIQLLRSRLQQDSYRLLAPEECPGDLAGEMPFGKASPKAAFKPTSFREGDGKNHRPWWVPPPVAIDASEVEQPRDYDGRDPHAAAPSSGWWTAEPTLGTRSKHPLIGTPPPSSRMRRSFPGTASNLDHPPPGEWERRIRYCLSTLKRRPLLCPETLLRGTGAVPCLSPETCVRGAMAASTRLTEAPRFDSGGFPLSHVCLWLTLDLVEQAVLGEGGGEAAAGLLRALRTPRAVGGVALAAGGRGKVEGGDVWRLVGLLEKVPSGCAVNALEVLTRALQDVGERHRSPNAPRIAARAFPWRPFEAELWLLLLGYRHWLLVAMVQLVSAGGCASCKRVTPTANPNNSGAEKQRGESAEDSAAPWLLAWYACGGFTKPSVNLKEALGAIRQAAACLHAATATAKSAGARDDSVSPQHGGVSVTGALKAAGRSGQGLVGDTLAPCMAGAWLLTSRIALEECEEVLACSILRIEDLSEAFQLEKSTEQEELPSSGHEGVLQGLAALEDLVWLCGLSPPLLHVHRGEDLKRLLGRIKAWLSGLDTRWRGSDAATAASGGGGCDASLSLIDFGVRRDIICRRLEALLVAVPSRQR